MSSPESNPTPISFRPFRKRRFIKSGRRRRLTDKRNSGMRDMEGVGVDGPPDVAVPSTLIAAKAAAAEAAAALQSIPPFSVRAHEDSSKKGYV